VNPGTIVDGKYKIERQLGEGGMATVYSAMHMHLNEKVAIKVLLANLAGSANIVERFMREARAAVRLKSEHVVRVKDVGALPSSQPFIVMEFLDGTDLEALLHKRGRIPYAEVVDYVMQVCEALAEAHAAGIVHRDIKPANCVLATRNDGMPSIKVLDFGIAKMMLGDDAAKLTATSATMGTPAFMSPEQIRGAKDVDHRGDIWSVGVMLFELMMGKVPFIGDTYGRLVMAVMREPTPPMPDIPPGLVEVINKCLAKTREERYQTVAELARGLEPFATNRAEAAVLAQRCEGLARPRVATPPAGVPVAPQGPTTPAHGNQPMMSTPAQGMPPQPQNPMMMTPGVGMPAQRTHGGGPMMSTPGHGMPSSSTHGGRTPAYGNQPMSTPGHGNPPYATPPVGSPPYPTPPVGNPPYPAPAGNPPYVTPPQGSPPSPQPAPEQPAVQATPAKSKSRVVTFVVIGLLVGGIAGAAIFLMGCQEPGQKAPPSSVAPIDLNRATEKQLEALPAIGPKHARSIIASRNARGGQFKSLDELLQIDGIGPKTVDAIRPYVFVGP